MIFGLLTPCTLLLLTTNLVNTRLLRAAPSATDARLPTNIVPIHYNLYLKTYLPGYEWQADERNLTFNGTVIVLADVVEATDKVVLHADSLDIEEVTFRDGNTNITRWEVTPKDQFLTIYLAKKLVPRQSFDLFITFKGKLTDKPEGFYLSHSMKPDGSGVINAVTQFETTWARKMVPCFDEPEFKAAWSVELEYPTGAVALSNGIELSTDTDKEWTVTVYEKTVKMSSYLLAVFIGDVQYKETMTDSGVRIRVYVDPIQINNIDTVLNVSRKTIEGFEKKFGVKYPMSKLDFVGVSNFFAGAMENWGLIVQRNELLLGEDAMVITVAVHELAHQWFGNLVTMKYWDEAWLNEGLTEFMEAEGISYVKPGFDKDYKSTTQDQQVGFLIDKRSPLHGFDKEAIGLSQIFYKKGSSFIRMIQKLVGDSNLTQAFQYYLNENQYKNVEEQDLYEAIMMFAPELEGPDGKPFDLVEFAYCWTHQNGYPTVYVEKGAEGTVVISQKMEVMLEKGFENFGVCGYKWDIPIWYQNAQSDEIQLAWLDRNDEKLELEVDLPVLINADSIGFYKVVYSDELYTQYGDTYKNVSQHYSNSSKFRLIMDASDAVWRNGSEPRTFLSFLKIVLNDPFTKNVAKRLLAKAAFKEARKSNPDSDVLKVLEELVDQHFPREPLFEKCSLNDTLSECHVKSAISCERILVDKNYDTVVDRLFKWLNKDTKMELDALIDCAVPEDIIAKHQAPETSATTKPAWRLPTNVIPLYYDLRMEVYLPGYGWELDENNNMTTEATVVISVEAVEATDKIVFHSDGLKIKGVSTDVELFTTTVTKWELTPEHQLITVYLSETLAPGTRLSFKVRYSGKIRTDLQGLYLTRSYKPNGDTVFNAVTQFEPTDARKMVPCFDEPEFKAKWNVALHHPAGSVALSNGIESSVMKKDNTTTITIFNGTVKMSSYLLAIFVGDVVYKETTTDSGVRIRVYTDPLNIDQVDFALNVSRHTVEGFEKQFGIDYPMKKIDFVCALDFQYGAMENWGLIVHSSNDILGESDQVRDTVIHELAHQWFGNLVTMQFWDNLWLNEGFAEYMTYRGEAYLDPSFDREIELVSQSQAKTLEKDFGGEMAISDYTHQENGQIDNTGLIYAKGASFLRMIEHIMGSKNFDLAIKYYLSVNQYLNVESQDLYDAFTRFMPSETLGPYEETLNLAEFARCWTDQNGYPTLYVDLKDNETYVLTQKYLGLTEANGHPEPVCGHKWDIPVWYQMVGSEEVGLMWMARDDEKLKIKSEEPLIFNANSNGVYRVKYSNEALSKLVEQFDPTHIYSDSTKYRLLSDVTWFLQDFNLHSVLSIIGSLIDDANDKVRYLAQSLLSQAQENNHSPELKPMFEELVSENIKVEPLFSACAPKDGFKECLKKSNITSPQKLCLPIRHAHTEEADLQRILDWLRDGQPVFRLLECAHLDVLERVLEKNPDLRQTVMTYIDKVKKIKESPSRRNFMSYSNSMYNFI